MKKHEPLSTAKAVISLLVFAIAATIFYKFYTNQELLFNDLNALKSYVVTAIIACGFLIGLVYLVSHTTHGKVAKVSKSTKSSKKKKK